MRRKFGVKATPKELVEFLEYAEQAPAGTAAFLPTYYVRGLFRDYSRMWPESGLLPAHTRIAFDAQGLGPHGDAFRGTRTLEVTMYEDMAALCNLAVEQSTVAQSAAIGAPTKLLLALCRATVASAVYFVEAYLNGVAFDHLAQQDRMTLGAEEKSILEDWDPNRKQPRYLKLREKLIRYQRIITKQAHAPVQESNCPEMARIVQVAESIRNALAHPSPNFNPKTGTPDKESAIYGIDLSTACDAADCSVALVHELERVLYGNGRRIPWLRPRGEDGRFPAETFE